MKHLVLGSSGQIGAHLVKYLQDKGQQVYEMDIEYRPYHDLRLQENMVLNTYLDTCDIVHFLAYDVGGAKYLEKNQDKFDFINNNMRIMSNTFELINKFKKPFIFASSQMSEMGYSSYGMLKALGEKITKDLGGLVVRFWNVYGYEQDEEKSHVITDFIKMAKYKGEINMRTNGKESRQFLYADDACECLYKLSQQYPLISRMKDLHITSFKWNTINEVADIVDVLSSCKINRADREDQTQQNAMNEPSTDILEYWKPKTKLEEGITKLYNLY